jgi:hypothetical protein
VLVSSAEHYGAVINLDFDFVPYLEELERNGLNQTRVWSGFYVEDSRAFGITDNTLAPAAGRYQPAWARSDQPGYANGGNRFDLSRWNPAFFTRLKRFVAEAARRDVMVEIVLFCPFYEDSMWRLSPLNPINNVNGLGEGLTRTTVHDRSDARVTAFQESYVRKIVTELNAFDNIYFEIANEPYAHRLIDDGFERRIADVIVETERALPKQHLIAQNVANGSAAIDDPHPVVSIFNFHYAAPPTTVELNYGLGKVIADDETGFRGQADLPYRIEAWQFLLAGGGIFSHLDYSFTTGHPAGTWMPLPPNQPGGGGPRFRRQMRILGDFVRSFAFVRMRPATAWLAEPIPANLAARALVEEGRQYAVYVSLADTGRGNADRLRNADESTLAAVQVTLPLVLPAGRFDAQWIRPADGWILGRERFDHPGGRRPLESPAFAADVALRIVGRPR